MYTGELLPLYNYVYNMDQNLFDNDIFRFCFPGIIEVNPERFFYINLDNPKTPNYKDDLTANLHDVVWRLLGSDDASLLDENSFLRQYIPTEEQKNEFLKLIDPNLLDPTSDAYKEYNGELKLNELTKTIFPLYNYPRYASRMTTLNFFDNICPMSKDKQIQLLEKLKNDPKYNDLNEEGKKKYFEQISVGIRHASIDQIEQLFFSLKNKYFLDYSHRYVVNLTDPGSKFLPTGKEHSSVANIFSQKNPFPMDLDSFQLLFVDNKVSIRLNFNNFDMGNMFDLLYGIVILQLASKISELEIGTVYIYSSYFHINARHYDFFKSVDPKTFLYYNLSLKTDSAFEDFSDLKPHHLLVDYVN